MSRVNLKGLLIPMEWDDDDRITELALLTDDEDEFLISGSGDILSLERCVQENLVLECDLDGNEITTIYSYEVTEDEDWDEDWEDEDEWEDY